MHLYYHYELKAGFELIKEGVQKDAEGNPLDPIVFYYIIRPCVNSDLLPYKLPLKCSLPINIYGTKSMHSVWEMVLCSLTHGNFMYIKKAVRMLQLNTQTTVRDKKVTAMTFAVLLWADKWLPDFIAKQYQPPSKDMESVLSAVRRMLYATRY